MDPLNVLTWMMIGAGAACTGLAIWRDDGRLTALALGLYTLALLCSDCATVVVVQGTGTIDAPATPATSPQDGQARDGGP